jgi:hypothetical protein
MMINTEYQKIIFLMKYQQLKNWLNNPKAKALLVIIFIIKLFIVVMVAIR